MAAISLLEGIGALNGLAPKAAQTKPKNQVVKRVSWAPDYNLCKVRLFLAEDAPLQSDLADQDHLQAKQSRLWHAYGSGFEGNQLLGVGNNYTKQNIQEDSIVPETTWCCPPRFVMNPSWQVVAGDESLEVKVQCEREVRNLEAIYPRPSSIPPSPIEPLEPQEDYSDSDTPMIPLIPIEDDETGDLNEVPPSQDFGELGIGLYDPFGIMHNMKEMQPNCTGASSQGGDCVVMVPPSVDQQRQASLSISKPAAEPDITAAAAAAAAFDAIAKSNEKGNMIDHDMVLKILSNPQIIEALTSQHRRNNNIQMDLMPNLHAIDSKHDAPKTPCNVDQDQSPLIISGLQGACQVASSGVVGNNRSSLVTSEMACGNFQGPLHLLNTEAKNFGAAVAVAQTSTSMTFSPPLPPMAGQASSHLSSRPATVSVSTTMGVCQPSMGASTGASTAVSVNQSSFPDEQYYKNLIQKHGLQNDNDQIKHPHGLQNDNDQIKHLHGLQNDNDQIKHPHGFQYYRDLIQQHGGADKFEEQKCQGSHILSGNNDRVGGGNFANNERAFGDPNRFKFRKPCLYFNTPNGCRRGASCAFLHEDFDRPKFDVSDLKHSKRAKAETEAPVRN